MDTFRIEDFIRDNPDHPLPEFRKVPPDEAQALEMTFARHAGFDGTEDALTLLLTLLKSSVRLDEVSSRDESFSTETALSRADVTPGRYAYVDWGRFDDIDEFAFADLERHLDDIHYNEDISIFDETCTWLLFLMHYGDVRLVKH